MKRIDTLFDRMDAWRHLPSYQLERRADLFFSLYLPEVLEAKLGFAIQNQIVPEFPVRIGTIYPDIPIDKSYKIDYVVLSADAEKAILVELKTEGMSRRDNQDKYLLASRKAGLPILLGGVLDIFRATNSKRKYFCLLEHLESMGLLRIPMQMKEIMTHLSLQGVTEVSREIEITTQATESIIVYVQPNGNGPDIISFEEFRSVVQKHDDPVSQRFARSLREWADTKAGEIGDELDMDGIPPRFIGEPIEVQFDRAPTFTKKPGCPDRFVWNGETYRVIETLSEWKDYERRGRMARNMSPVHAAVAARRGSWGVGRFYFRVRVETGQVFELYYDRAPKNAEDRKGAWHLFQEMRASESA